MARYGGGGWGSEASDILSQKSLPHKTISLGNQDNLTTINTLSEEKLHFALTQIM